MRSMCCWSFGAGPRFFAATRLRTHRGLLGRPGEVALALVASEAAPQLEAEQGPRSHNATIIGRGLSTLIAIPQPITARYVGRPGLPRPQLRARALSLLHRPLAVARLACAFRAVVLSQRRFPLHPALAVLARTSAPPTRPTQSLCPHAAALRIGQ